MQNDAEFFHDLLFDWIHIGHSQSVAQDIVHKLQPLAHGRFHDWALLLIVRMNVRHKRYSRLQYTAEAATMGPHSHESTVADADLPAKQPVFARRRLTIPCSGLPRSGSAKPRGADALRTEPVQRGNRQVWPLAPAVASL